MEGTIPTLLNKESSTEKIEAYAKSLNKSLDKQDINEIFSNLNALIIDSYSFTYGANLVARNITKDFAAKLNDYLEAYEHDIEHHNRDYAFISYYLLAYYYREYEGMTNLEKLVIRYNDKFTEHYALAHQIEAVCEGGKKGNGRKLFYVIIELCIC